MLDLSNNEIKNYLLETKMDIKNVNKLDLSMNQLSNLEGINNLGLAKLK